MNIAVVVQGALMLISIGCNMQPDVNSYLRENSKKPSLSTILTVASSDNDSNNENFNVSKVL